MVRGVRYNAAMAKYVARYGQDPVSHILQITLDFRVSKHPKCVNSVNVHLVDRYTGGRETVRKLINPPPQPSS